MKIGIINAMQVEHEQIAQLLKDKRETAIGQFRFVEGTLGSNHLIMARSGIGKVNAAVGAVELINWFSPNYIINTGVAGGIDTSLKVMDVVAGKRVVYHDVDCGPENMVGQVQGLPPYYEADELLYNHATSLEGCTVRGGLICSGDQFITDRAQLDAIKAKFPGGLAVDMESGAIAQVCHLYGIPFLSFRIISDTPGAADHFGQYLDFWGTMAEKSFAVTRTFLASLS